MTLFEKRHGIPALIAGIGVSALFLVGAAPAMALTPQDEGAGEAPQDPGASDQAKGEAALAEARSHLDNARWQAAAEAYREALRHMPSNEEARVGLDTALRMIDQGPGLEQEAQTQALRRARALAEFDAGLEESRELLEQDQFNQAETRVIQAQVQLNNARAFLSESEFTERQESAQQLLGQISQAEELHLQQQREREQEQIRSQREQEQQAEQRRRQQQIEQNLRRVRELQLQRDYDEALQVIDQILFLDEGNPVALALRDAIQTAELYQSFITDEREREFSYSWTFQQNREAMIAPRANFGPGPKSTTGLMVYPEDWPELSVRRTSDAGYFETDANRRVAAALDDGVIHNVTFENNTVEQVLAYMEQVTDQNIVADWKSLEFIGVYPDNRVNLSLKNVPPRILLERVLDQLGEQTDRPEFAIQDGLLVISTDDAIRQHVFTKVYDISDLLFEVPYFDNAPTMDLDEALRGPGGAASAAMSGAVRNSLGGSGLQASADAQGSYRGDSPGIFNDGGPDPDRPTRKQKVEEIIQVIQGNVDPEGWMSLGGDTGRLEELGGNLIITQTPRNHRSIEGLLSQLREIRAIQINIESRFLTVDMNWFEKIGFDLDLFFNTNNTMFQQARAVDPNFQLGDFFFDDGRLKDPIIFGSSTEVNDPNQPENTFGSGNFFGIPDGTFTNGFGNTQFPVGPFGPPIRNRQGFSPIGVTQDSFNLVDLLGGFGGDTFAGQILTSNPAVSIGIQFLDDVQVDLLIEATQADRRNVVLTAPRLTIFNGQRSWVLVGSRQAFVSTLVPVVGDQSGAFFPIVDSLTDGVVLDVEAVVSADRRYVTMTVITGISEVVSIDQVEFSGAAGGGGIGGGQAANFNGTISLPTLEVALIQTTTSIPDRGTVLLGGQRLVTEVEVEVGVPILSKIPFVNRFFTNRVTSKDESTLLILIRPEIIIQQENEELLFPGLSDQLGVGGF